MTSPYIFHMCQKSLWDDALASGFYEGGALDKQDGFIHFSTAAQVRETAARYLAGVSGLLLIKVDPEMIGDALKWEESRDNLLFPHLYDRLSIKNVVSATELPLGADGAHIFPDLD
jgi:uncharacterized protein (DUF952 family)